MRARWPSMHLPSSKWKEENQLDKNNFSGFRDPGSIERSCFAKREACFTAWFRCESDLPQCKPQSQLHNWQCNQYLREFQPKALLTPLQSCWIISKPHDWMIHWSPWRSWLSGVDLEVKLNSYGREFGMLVFGACQTPWVYKELRKTCWSSSIEI